MNKLNWKNICKILCLVLCACFMLTACADETKKDEMSLVNGSESAAQVTASHNACLSGDILRVMYKDIGNMTTDVYKTLTSENLLSLVILAFTIWMAFQILQHVSSPTPESSGEFWTKVLRKAFICTICGTLASSPENILYAVNTFIFPIYTTILEFTGLIMEQLGKSPEAQTVAIALPGAFPDSGQLCEAFVHSVGSCNFGNLQKIQMSTTSGFPTEPMEMMSCMACVINDRLAMGYKIAYYLLSLKITLTTVVVAVMLLVAFTATKWGFALYLIDGIFRLNMMIIIMPFLIMFYPFEQTRKWSIKGLQIILSSAAIMMCLGLVVSMTVFAMEKLLIDKNAQIPYGELEQYMDFGIIAMSLLFMSFVVKQACDLAVQLAGHVTGYGGDNKFAKNITNGIKWVGGIALGLLTAGAWAAWGTAYRYIKWVRSVQHGAEKIRNNVMGRINHWAGRDEE